MLQVRLMPCSSIVARIGLQSFSPGFRYSCTFDCAVRTAKPSRRPSRRLCAHIPITHSHIASVIMTIRMRPWISPIECLTEPTELVELTREHRTQSVIWELSRDRFRANPRPLFSHDSATPWLACILGNSCRLRAPNQKKAPSLFSMGLALVSVANFVQLSLSTSLYSFVDQVASRLLTLPVSQRNCRCSRFAFFYFRLSNCLQCRTIVYPRRNRSERINRVVIIYLYSSCSPSFVDGCLIILL
ncbi:hypothetical protein B0H14DRAFT_3146932 [Mycena olivaceomarginata]|nr:hypothetical protein B0H14DRAFT_3146932 [Mycena olivaceomarginata]